jgi:UDP-hydrolysing UDP-N-acetyl-D-glucosamine 2-epimerase
VTTSRADYSSLLPILRLINNDPELELLLFVGAMHLAPQFGLTLKDIETDAFPIADRVEMLLASDTPLGVAKSIGLGVIGFAESLSRHRPDILMIIGDRYELLSVACAALALGIPVAHVSGGDLTEGAIDNQVRFALTKLSHLHFVAMETHAKRLCQMGEESWRIFVTGEPALDLLHQIQLLSREELANCLGLNLTPPILVVTLHPTTISEVPIREQVSSLLSALSHVRGTLVFTYPNADVGHSEIIDQIQTFVREHPNSGLFFNLGHCRYYSLLAIADLMVGNSSSGIWEAPSFCLPVVNVGERQRGRVRAGNVIDVSFDADAISEGIRQALEPHFRSSLQGMRNPYGDGHASERIVRVLKQVNIDYRLLQKHFVEIPLESAETDAY